MKKCTYFLGDTAYTYQELVDMLQSNPDIVSVSDIVYSKASKQEAVTERLREIKKEYNFKRNASFVDGEPNLEGVMTTQEFIDSPRFRTAEGELIPKLNQEKYIENKAKQLVTEKQITEEQALYEARQEVANWELMGNDFMELHSILNGFDFRQGVYEFEQRLKGTKFEGVANDLYASMQTFMREEVYGPHKGETSTNTIKNMNLESELVGGLGKIVGHIDYLLIDSRGTLHIYNFKASTQNSNQWDKAKWTKYKYQLALIKQMLANHGFNVRDVSLNIVPIRVNYSDDFSQITSVVPEQHAIDITMYDSKYVFSKYDRVARSLIPSGMQELEITSEAAARANRTLAMMFPEKDVKATGIQKTVTEQIRQAYRTGMIKPVNEPGHYYDVIIDDVAYPIKSPETPTKNQEIIDLFQDNYGILEDDGAIVASNLVKAIENSYQLGFPNFDKSRGFSFSASYLNQALGKYFQNYEDAQGNKYYDWEFIDNDILLSANMLMFRNNRTNQVDVISLSPYDLNVEAKFRRGNTIAGHYVYDSQSQGLLKPIYGNIEAMRAMALLNEIVPELDNCNFGILKVISPLKGGSSKIFQMEQLNDQMNKFISIIKSNNADAKDLVNNFTKSQARFKDPFDTLTEEYRSIIEGSKLSQADQQNYVDLGFDNLTTENSDASKTQQLFSLMENILDYREDFRRASPKQIYEMAKSGNSRTKTLANLYILVRNAYAYYSGDNISQEEKISSFRRNLTTWDKHPSKNVRLVSNIVQQAYDRVNYESTEQYAPIRKYVMDYYDKIGYGAVRNSTIGDQASTFKNMYEVDEKGNNLLLFKNPYKDTTLTQPEKEFLKKALFTFNKIRVESRGGTFNFKDENDSSLQDFINNAENHYFWVPLEKASVATRRQHGESQVKEIKSKLRQFFQDPKKIFREYIEGITTEEEQEIRDQELSRMQLSNKFRVGESDVNSRANYILKHSPEFFETNIENLLADFLVAYIAHKEMNKALIRAKSILLGLYISGEEQGENYDATMKDIEDFLKLNIFNRSIMEESSQKVVGMLQPVRSFASKLLVGANVIGATRDVFQGVWNNSMRVINKYMTDISAKSMGMAYEEVLKNIFTNVRSVSKLSLLNKQFKISFDASVPAEALKTGRGGIFNYQEYLYSTLRRPDFLNRMSIFVARCMEDGCYDALYEEDGELKYNWKKDKRFSVFASGKQDDPKYSEQRGLYLSKIRQYNQEHPDKQIEYTDDLPMPYSDQEIQSIKNVANTIYGAYDKSLKAKYENMAIGWGFGQFTTWMNSWFNNYFMKPDAYENGVLRWEQDRNEAGELLYWDKDFNLTTKVTDAPAYRQVPMMVQGIWYTIKDGIHAIKNGGRNEFMEQIWQDPIQRRNLAKLFSDILMFMLFSVLFKFAFDPAYKDFKKNSKDYSLATNAIVEILYKGSSQSYEDLLGPLSIVEWMGKSQSPAMYRVPVTAVTDLGKVLMGDKTLMAMVQGYTPFLRQFKDTYKTIEQTMAD